MSLPTVGVHEERSQSPITFGVLCMGDLQGRMAADMHAGESSELGPAASSPFGCCVGPHLAAVLGLRKGSELGLNLGS